MKLIAVVGVTLTVLAVCEGVTFSRCQLVHQLRMHGFPEHEIRDWVCLVEHESGGNTNAIGKLNADGSWDYGLFQISNKYWCNPNYPGKDCNISCEQLLTDDISVAASCAKKVFSRHGFYAWYGWVNNCRGSLPDISLC